MTKTAYFAGGCFWCITPSFKEAQGVISVTSGYAGGDEENPTYEDVKQQKTGHRETIEIVYDDALITYNELFDIYLGGIDPYDAGGQFIDRGFSYTLAVYCTDETQRDAAIAKIAWAEEQCGQKLAISVESFKNFYKAEEYHQDYYLKNPEAFEKELIESGRKART